MKCDDIIQLAREAGFSVGIGSPVLPKLTTLVLLAATHVQEAMFARIRPTLVEAGAFSGLRDRGRPRLIEPMRLRAKLLRAGPALSASAMTGAAPAGIPPAFPPWGPLGVRGDEGGYLDETVSIHA